jgi:hypothetical protein
VRYTLRTRLIVKTVRMVIAQRMGIAVGEMPAVRHFRPIADT